MQKLANMSLQILNMKMRNKQPMLRYPMEVLFSKYRGETSVHWSQAKHTEVGND